MCPLHTEAWGRGWDKFASTYHTLLHRPRYLGAGGCLPLRSWSPGSHAEGSTFLLATRDSKVTLYRARHILGIQCIVGKWILQQIQRWKTTARELLTSQPCFKNRPPIKNGKWGGGEREQKKLYWFLNITPDAPWKKIQNVLRSLAHEKLLLGPFQKNVLIRTLCRTHPGLHAEGHTPLLTYMRCTQHPCKGEPPRRRSTPAA